MNEYYVKREGDYNTTAVNEPTDRESEFSNTITLFTLEENVCIVQDLFPTPEESGPFLRIAKSQTPAGDFLRSVGLNDEEISHSIDIEYVYNHSGTKYLSRLVRQLIKKNNVLVSGGYPISQLDFDRICNIISARYSQKWKRLYETVTADFVATEPFKMSIDEKITDELTSTRNNNNSDKTAYESSQKDNSSSNANGSERNNTYGFNGAASPDGDPRNKTINEDTVTTETENTSKSNSTNTQEKIESYHRDNPITRKTERSGNIGNISMQELTNQQREMLQWQFWDVVFLDCDAVITNGRYQLTKRRDENF